MSIFTSIWNLLKKNPATDGNEMFNIETMLNDNWDKIDSALGMKAVNADVRAATIANIALSGLQTVDGVALAAGDRVLVKNQAVGNENGIYVASSAGWVRASDADSSGKLAAGVFIHVKEGSANAGTGWILTTTGRIELDVTPLTFALKTGSSSATDAVIGSRTADPNTSVAYGLSGSVTQLFSWVLKYFKAITGKANPFDPPDMTLASAKAHVDATAPHSGHAVIGRKVNTSGGLQGGGDLSADRTLSIADAGVTDAHIGTRTIDDSIPAAAGADTPTRLWSKLANMIKAITGKSNWWTPPVTTIEALNANKLNTSAYTAADVLVKIKTVDGSGSGLNADGLDGYHADVASNVNSVAVRDANGWITARGVHSDAPQGTAPLVVDSSTRVDYLNADMVDGYHVSDLLRNFLAGNNTNLNTLTNSGVYRLSGNPVNGPAPAVDYGQLLVLHGAADTITQIAFPYGAGYMFFRNGNPSDVGGSGSWGPWNRVWSTGNQGAGSGMDADSVDGLHAADLMTRAPIEVGGIDLNNLTSSGFFIGANLVNNPTGVSTDWFYIISIVHPDPNYICQTAYSYFSGRMWIRRKAVAWQPWIEVLTSVNGVSRSASSKNIGLSSTSETEIASFTPLLDGNFDVKAYLHVGSNVNVTVKVEFHDGYNTQTTFMINNQNLEVGGYSLLPAYIFAKAGQTIRIKAAASASNIVAVSASIIEL